MFRKFREGREKLRAEQERQRQENERAKWLTVPIKDQRRFVDYHPPRFEELANRAIERAGSGVEFDPNAVPVYFVGLWLILATKAMEAMKGYDSMPDVVNGLWIIPQRNDFEYNMLWDYLTMQGVLGRGVHLFMAKEMQSFRYIEEVAGAIRRGEVRDAEAVSRTALRR